MVSEPAKPLTQMQVLREKKEKLIRLQEEQGEKGGATIAMLSLVGTEQRQHELFDAVASGDPAAYVAAVKKWYRTHDTTLVGAAKRPRSRRGTRRAVQHCTLRRRATSFL